MKTISVCKDCGPEGVHHGLEYGLNIANWLVEPFTNPLDRVTNIALRKLGNAGIIDRLAGGLMDRLLAWKVVTAAREPDAKDALAVQMLWNEAKARGIALTEYRFPNGKRNTFTAEFGGARICFDGLPRPRGSAADSVGWMDNKAVLKKKLSRAGFPVAKGAAAWSEAGALRIFRSIGKPAIAKPHVGSGSRHTTIHLADEPTLLAAFRTGKIVSPFVVIEEELAGSVFRATVIGGKLAGVIRRDPPQVVGTGRSNVRRLIEKENKHPKRQGPIFHPLATGIEAEAELVRQGLTWESVPKKGRVVTLNQKINWSAGGTTKDVTDETHPENVKLFERLGAFLADPLIGIDFIMERMDRPWTDEPKCGVIEVNSLPFIDNHHLPFSGEPRNVAGALWDIVFPESKR